MSKIAPSNLPQELDVFCMCPNQRHGGATRSAADKVPFRQIRLVPNLLWYIPWRVRLFLDDGRRFARCLTFGAQNLRVRAFACQQRPSSTDSTAIERPPVTVLAIVIIWILVPYRARCSIRLEVLVDIFHGLSYSWVIRSSKAESRSQRRRTVGMRILLQTA